MTKDSSNPEGLDWYRRYFGYSKSRSQEQLVEYTFLRDFIVEAARKDLTPFIGRGDFDAFGFDLILGLKENGSMVKVQMKAFNGKTRVWDVHRALVENGGQVVVVKIEGHGESISVKYRALRSDRRASILANPPRKAHKDKCRMNYGDTEDITNDLLRLVGYGAAT
ncbi:MAG: hypothetical protein ABI432_10955 [Flavobacteriales bacterium]